MACKVLNCVIIISCVICALLLALSPLYAIYTSNEDNDTDFAYYEKAISFAIRTTPKEAFLDWIMISANIIVAFISYCREVQLRVLFERGGEYTKFIRFINIFNSITLGLGAFSWIAAITIDHDDNGLLHFIFSASGFVLTLLYHFIHTILTLISRCKCYNTIDNTDNFFCRYFELFYMVISWIIAAVFATIFLVYQLSDEAVNNDPFFNEDTAYFYEWWSFWLLCSQYIILGILFARDPVDDELEEFCCKGPICCCCDNKYELTHAASDYNRNQLQISHV